MWMFKRGKKAQQVKQTRRPSNQSPVVERHECNICGVTFPTADDLSAHFPDHKELFESIEKTVGKGETRDLGETINPEDYRNFQYTEATASDLETLVMTERGIREWGRRKEFTAMKWVGVLLAGGIGLVIVLYIMMELMPGLLGG